MSGGPATSTTVRAPSRTRCRRGARRRPPVHPAAGCQRGPRRNWRARCRALPQGILTRGQSRSSSSTPASYSSVSSPVVRSRTDRQLRFSPATSTACSGMDRSARPPETTPRCAAEHGYDLTIEAEVPCRADRVDGLAAGNNGPHRRPVDRAGDQTLDGRRLVHGGVERYADDPADPGRGIKAHDAACRPIAASTSRESAAPRCRRWRAWTAIRRPRPNAGHRPGTGHPATQRGTLHRTSRRRRWCPRGSRAGPACAPGRHPGPGLQPRPGPAWPPRSVAHRCLRRPPSSTLDRRARERPDRRVHVHEASQPDRLGGVGQDDVSLCGRRPEPAVPATGRIPVGVEAGRQPCRSCCPEQVRQLGCE